MMTLQAADDLAASVCEVRDRVGDIPDAAQHVLAMSPTDSPAYRLAKRALDLMTELDALVELAEPDYPFEEDDDE